MNYVDLNALKEEFDLRDIIISEKEKWHTSQASGERRKMVVCPFHQDNDPSMEVGRLYYSCYGCGAWGSIVDWLQFSESLSFQEAVDCAVELSGKDPDEFISLPSNRSKGLSVEHDPVVPSPLSKDWEGYVAERRDELFESDALGDLSDQWAIGPAVAWFFELGYEKDHFVLPVRNKNNELVTVRYKRHLVPSQHKYWGVEGRNPPLLYHESSLYRLVAPSSVLDMEKPKDGRPQKAVICFGEFAAICCQQAFVELGETVACVSPTNGTRSWVRSWRRKFAKCSEVFIIPDVAEEQYAVSVASCFPKKARIVFLEGEKGFDVNDYMLYRSPSDLVKLLTTNSIRYGDVFRYYSRGGGVKWESI